MRIAGVELRDARPVAGGDICAAYRAHLGDGTAVFAKTHRAPPDGFFTAEAAGLATLRDVDGPPVPEVLAVGADGLVLAWIEPGQPSVAAARAFGMALARMHAAALPSFGAASDGYIGSLPLPNASYDDWPTFYVDNRIKPYLGQLSASQRRLLEAVCERIAELAGPPEPPARIHGD